MKSAASDLNHSLKCKPISNTQTHKIDISNEKMKKRMSENEISNMNSNQKLEYLIGE